MARTLTLLIVLALATTFALPPSAADHFAQHSWTNKYCTHPLLGDELRSCNSSGASWVSLEQCSSSGCDFSVHCSFGVNPILPFSQGLFGEMTCTGVFPDPACADLSGVNGCGDSGDGLLFVAKDTCPVGVTIFTNFQAGTLFGTTSPEPHNYNVCVDGNGVGHVRHA